MAKSPSKQEEPQGSVAVKTRVKKPSMYRVVLLNDDFTPMDFVVSILQSVFDKTLPQAQEIMLQVHEKGVGECGVFVFEIAEVKAAQVVEMARRSQHPLRCEIERA